MYKVFASDIDNTLTQFAKEVPQVNYDAVRRAIEAGIKVVLATGRGYVGAIHICRALDLHGPVITFGGAKINDIDTGDEICGTAMDPELILELLELAADYGVHAHIYQGDGIVYERESPFGDQYAAFLGLKKTIDPDIRKKQWSNVPKLLYITSPERVKELEPVLTKHFEGRLEVSLSRPTYIEFTTAGVNKGSALKWLAEDYWHVKREEVAAAGDNTLDNSMIVYAGLGAAVKDGAESTLAAADIEIPACADNGVAWLIDNILLKG